MFCGKLINYELKRMVEGYREGGGEAGLKGDEKREDRGGRKGEDGWKRRGRKKGGRGKGM